VFCLYYNHFQPVYPRGLAVTVTLCAVPEPLPAWNCVDIQLWVPVCVMISTVVHMFEIYFSDRQQHGHSRQAHKNLGNLNYFF